MQGRRCKCIKQIVKYVFASNDVSRRMFILFGLTYCLILSLKLFFLKADIESAKNETALINNERLQTAIASLQEYYKTHGAYDYKSENNSDVDIALGLVTSNRAIFSGKYDNPYYLTQSVAALVKLLQGIKDTLDFKLKLHLFICNVESEEFKYVEARTISEYIPTVAKYSGHSVPRYANMKRKERLDYAFCLVEGAKRGGRYVMLIEDDTLPHADFLYVLQHTVFHHIESRIMRHEQHIKYNDLAYVKFYHPSTLNNYFGLETQRWSEWVILSFILTSLSVLICSRFWLPAAKFPVQLWLFLFVYFMLLLLVIGRTNIIEFRRLFSPHLYIFGPAPSCCTQAMLYTRDMALKFAGYLESPKVGERVSKDTALDTFLVEEHLRGFIVEPNTFTHIGMITTLRGYAKTVINPYLL